MGLKAGVDYDYNRIKKGRRLIGVVFSFPNGHKVFAIRRKVKHCYRAGMKSVSEAMRAEVAAWSFESELITKALNTGASYICVVVDGAQECYYTDIRNFQPEYGVVQTIGGVYKRIPLQHWRRYIGKIKI